MFGKLMKNEFRNIGKLLILINTIVLGMHVLITIFEQVYNSGVIRGTIFEGIFAIFAVIYGISIFAVNLIVILVFAARFYRKVYSVEGYLTHTLPVNKTAIYFSMLLSSSIGTIITAVVSFGYVFIRMTNELGKAVPLAKIFQTAANYNITGLSYFLIVLAMILIVVASYALVFLCVSIGQNWKAHPVLGSILSYWIITTLLQIFGAVGIVSAANSRIVDSMFTTNMLTGDVINTITVYGICIQVIFIAITSVISIVIMKKRINL